MSKRFHTLDPKYPREFLLHLASPKISASCEKPLRLGSEGRYHISLVPYTISILSKLVDEARELAIDSETTGLDQYDPDVGIFAYSLSDQNGNAVALRRGHHILPCLACKGRGSWLDARTLRAPQLWTVKDCKTCGGQGSAPEALLVDYVVDYIACLPNVVKVLHNAKFDRGMARKHKVRIPRPFHDTMLMHYVLDPRRSHALKELAEKKLGESIEDEAVMHQWIRNARRMATSSIRKFGFYILDDQVENNADRIAFSHVPWEIMELYARNDVLRTMGLFYYARGPIKANKYYFDTYKLERKLLHTVSAMEQLGMRWDMAMAYRLLSIVKKDTKEFQRAAYREAHKEFNIASPKQLGEILFGDLGVAIMDKTAKGNPSTKKDHLVKYNHPLCTQVLRYRMTKKMDNFVRKCIKSTKREGPYWIIHSNILQIGTVTGRFSIIDPPLQTVPALDTGRMSSYLVNIRKCFIPRDGHLFHMFDYSQIEMKIFADDAQETNMINAINRGENIHKYVATEVTGVKPDDPEFPHCYKLAKVVDFLLIYGGGLNKLINTIHGDPEKTADFYNDYFERFPRIRPYMDGLVREARKTGVVMTRFGRRIPVNRDKAYKAVNYKIQGTAAGILKQALIDIHEALPSLGIKEPPLHSMHDEIILEPEEGLNHPTIIRRIKSIMEDRWKGVFAVPINIDIAVSASSWSDEVKVEATDDATINRSITEALRLRTLFREHPPETRDLRIIR